MKLNVPVFIPRAPAVCGLLVIAAWGCVRHEDSLTSPGSRFGEGVTCGQWLCLSCRGSTA